MARILIIEDEGFLREEVIDWLMLEGYDAVGAADGIEGVEIAFRQPPDLIVCDITMPGLDGYGVLVELRSNPVTAAIPFIFVTARATHEDLRKGMASGADDYIVKPFSRLEFLDAVETRLEKKRIQEQIRQQEVEHWQQAFEQEREQRLLKARLVAMFSHDFRNPLSSILSSASLLRDYSDRMDEARRKTHFSHIEISVHQLVQMIDDMLVVSQMESGHFDFKPEELDITELLMRIVAEFQTIHRDTHQIIYKGQVKDRVLADPRLVRQIVANLISNAIKYSPDGSDVLVMLEQEPAHLVLRVQDQGIGIPEADMVHIFEAFQRASNVDQISGTGLGLAIVKQAVLLHNGQIDIESQVGGGTTIIVKIPTE